MFLFYGLSYAQKYPLFIAHHACECSKKERGQVNKNIGIYIGMPLKARRQDRDDLVHVMHYGFIFKLTFLARANFTPNRPYIINTAYPHY